MNLNGYIKLHRKMMAWQWINHPPTFCLFIHLLLAASYEAKKSPVALQPGQALVGRAALARETGLTEKQVRIAIRNLISTGEITVDSAKGRGRLSVVTILNWNKYQVKNDGPFEGPLSEAAQPVENQGFQQDSTHDGAILGANNSRGAILGPFSRPLNGPFEGPLSEAAQPVENQGFQQDSTHDGAILGANNSAIIGAEKGPPIKEEGKKGKKGKKKDIYSDENGWPQFGDFVWMPQKEYDTLVDRFGEQFTTKCIETLGNYKGSSGKKYVSDYRAILNWVVDRVKKDYPLLMKRQPQQQQITTTRNESEWGDGI